MPAWVRRLMRLFGGAHDREHERFLADLTEIERQQIEDEALAAELEARVALLEKANPDAPVD